MKRWLIFTGAVVTLMQPLSGLCAVPADVKQPAPSPMEKALKGPDDTGALEGKVLETMNSGGYTYANVEKKDGSTAWIAVPETKITVGSTVVFKPGMPMGSFFSKSLNRKFESIIFSPGVAGDESGKDKDKVKELAHKGVDLSAGLPKGDKDAAIIAKVAVEKAAGKDARTVAEIFEQKDALADKTVVVRGKVMKASSGIMGRTWIHLRDGSGDPDKGTNNLIVTSQTTPAVGEVVTIKGTLGRNREFGAGYNYDVIVEDAEIIK